MRCCFDSVTAQLYIKHVIETGLDFNMFGLDQWFEHLLSSGIQMINLSIWAVPLLVPSSLPIANAVICMQCTESYVTATWQNVPAHHCLQTRQIYYNSICSSWALFSVLCYSLHSIQNNNYMFLWHCSTEFLQLKNHFLGSDRNSPTTIPSCCWKLIWDFPAPSQNKQFEK